MSRPLPPESPAPGSGSGIGRVVAGRAPGAAMHGYPALEGGAGLIDRSDRSRLLLTGADRRTYLQGLLTNDIVALGPGTGCYAAYLTAQGRMIADMRLFETGEALLVDLDGPVGPSVRDKWSLFIFSEDVQIQDLTASTIEIGLYGPAAAQVLAEALDAERTAGDSLLSAERWAEMPLYGNARLDFRGAAIFVLRSDDAGTMGFDLVAPAAVKDALAAALRVAGAVDVSGDAFEARRIEAGRPLFQVDMDTETIPLEAGIEGRAISLTKGCYVGQEIIIRVLHRGQGRVARRLVGLAFDASAALPLRGDTVQSGDREVGRVTSAALSPALGRPIALAYVHRDFVPPGTALTVAGVPAIVAALPFVPALPSR